MYVLGINAYHADASAVLLHDGRVVAAVEEERFRRTKHWAGFPTEAIRACLRIADIPAREVRHVGIARDPKAHLFRKAWFTLKRRPHPRLLLDRLANARSVRALRGPLAEALGVELDALPRLHFVEHHPAHLASAFHPSPFDEAAVCAIDGFGDFVSTSVGRGAGHRIEVLDRIHFPHSLGLLYTAVTQYLGFHAYGDEYKVMGLAPYGRPTQVDRIQELISLEPGGRFELRLDYFRHWSEGVEMEWESGYPTLGLVYTPALERLLGPARRPDGPLTSAHKDIARSVQVVFEECVFHILNALWERTRLPALCLAGGCAMNSVANGKIRTETPFTDVFIQPAAADNGTALGAALDVWHHVLDRPARFVMEHAFLGTAYPEPDVDWSRRLPEDDGWSYDVSRYHEDGELCRIVAGHLAEGKVVGWFQGRMEWGARALGNRSILADPRRLDMRERINEKIKLREAFRPFAPSILVEALDEYLVGAVPDPFMVQVYPVRKEKRSAIPAVTHVDGTARVQTVSEEANPVYHRLLREFGRLTGVPVLLNTSFNENEPIVESPEQALDCFLRTRMDVLVLNDTVIERSRARRPAGLVAG